MPARSLQAKILSACVDIFSVSATMDEAPDATPARMLRQSIAAEFASIDSQSKSSNCNPESSKVVTMETVTLPRKRLSFSFRCHFQEAPVSETETAIFIPVLHTSSLFTIIS